MNSSTATFALKPSKHLPPPRTPSLLIVPWIGPPLNYMGGAAEHDPLVGVLSERMLTAQVIPCPNNGAIEVLAVQSFEIWAGAVVVQRSGIADRVGPVRVSYDLVDAVSECILRLLEESRVSKLNGDGFDVFDTAGGGAREVYSVEFATKGGRRLLILGSETARIEIPREVARETAFAMRIAAGVVARGVADAVQEWNLFSPYMPATSS